jgi:hypothetical protein
MTATQILSNQRQMLAWLKANGINSIEEFVEHSSATLSSEQLRAMRQTEVKNSVKITEAMQKAAFFEECQPRKQQTAINVPFRVNKTIYDAHDISRFDNKSLHFFVNEHLLEQGMVEAFESKADLRHYLEENGEVEKKKKTIAQEVPTAYNHVPGSPARFYQHGSFGGARIDLQYRHAFWNLEEHTLSGWWFWRVSWNDQISSIQTTDWSVTCFEHAGLGGQSFTVGRNTNLPYVGNFWNDKISSALELYY